MTEHADPKPEKARLRRWRMTGIFVAVAVAEIGLFLLLGRARGPAQPPIRDPIFLKVELYDPPPPISKEPPAPETGGGAPAAPTVIHTPPPPKQERPRELPAPPSKVPEPALTVGVSPDPSPQPGFGQGGQGTGSGSGIGSGNGPGSGSTRARMVQTPPISEIRANHPPAARTRYGNAAMSCVVRLDQRLEDCQVISETPPGLGFGAAALRLSGQYRASPPTENGQPVEGQRLVFGIDFGIRPR